MGGIKDGGGRAVSVGSTEDHGHQISFRRRRHDLSVKGGMFQCFALDCVTWRLEGNHAMLFLRTFFHHSCSNTPLSLITIPDAAPSSK